ncbi:hypothetical protein HMPREF0591_6413 [Mycobacterium parascrofulaceum ATCC BAA-614]|uniref:Uncharacterized protein n=1 Tax=Mycobacterium parascrofulaceum ATCC BAA-614 TaxID=525368 RepID=D5PJR9_9MYCO|nr:hypothetical protein HMPREF0591_6413 [Mycobacterium parascrofulaceum ATCC BAA-614]
MEGTQAFRSVDRDIEHIADQTSRHTATESSRSRQASPAKASWSPRSRSCSPPAACGCATSRWPQA